jgi:16S rRNA (cytosine967-C5)-methyltransferase
MISPARKAAFNLLLELRQKPESHSDTLLHSKQVEALSPLDKNLATTLVMGVLRWQIVLQQRIREALTKSKGHLADAVQVSLELGALQLLLLDRIPARAAIFESVELVRQSRNPYAVGLTNAVLRKLTQAPKLQLVESCDAHPAWMVQRWAAAYGKEAAGEICRYDQIPPPTTIRLTSRNAETELKLEPGSFVTHAFRAVAGELSGMPNARVQDEGSQLIAELAGRGTAILDCCAAPGGKTAILAERNPTASITACDVSPRRLKAMQALLAGQPGNIRYRALDATEMPFREEFDLVLCDAPCSGTGTLARNPEIKHRVTAHDFGRQHERQVRLLRSALRSLREGGRLIYSTCSLEREENEAVISEVLDVEHRKRYRLLPWRPQVRALEEDGVLLAGTADHLFPRDAPDEFLRLLPGSYPGDGFFAACLTRS